MEPRSVHRVGVIADTHGLMRPDAMDALQGSGLIVHAGDVGSEEVLDLLRSIAPLVAVRGNVDQGAWAASLPLTVSTSVGGARMLVLHDLATLALDPAAAGFAVVVSGHSHRPAIDQRDGVLYLNPGSAGPRRFRFPVTLARLEVRDGRARSELLVLER